MKKSEIKFARKFYIKKKFGCTGCYFQKNGVVGCDSDESIICDHVYGMCIGGHIYKKKPLWMMIYQLDWLRITFILGAIELIVLAIFKYTFSQNVRDVFAFTGGIFVLISLCTFFVEQHKIKSNEKA